MPQRYRFCRNLTYSKMVQRILIAFEFFTLSRWRYFPLVFALASGLYLNIHWTGRYIIWFHHSTSTVFDNPLLTYIIHRRFLLTLAQYTALATQFSLLFFAVMVDDRYSLSLKICSFSLKMANTGLLRAIQFRGSNNTKVFAECGRAHNCRIENLSCCKISQ